MTKGGEINQGQSPRVELSFSQLVSRKRGFLCMEFPFAKRTVKSIFWEVKYSTQALGRTFSWSFVVNNLCNDNELPM